MSKRSCFRKVTLQRNRTFMQIEQRLLLRSQVLPMCSLLLSCVTRREAPRA